MFKKFVDKILKKIFCFLIKHETEAKTGAEVTIGMGKTAGELVCPPFKTKVKMEDLEKEVTTMKKVVLEASVIEVNRSRVILEFGRTQMEMNFSSRGSAARSLRPKEGDIIEVTLGVKKRAK